MLNDKDIENKKTEDTPQVQPRKKKNINPFQIVSMVLTVVFLAIAVVLFILIMQDVGWGTLFSESGRDELQEYIAKFGVWDDLVFIGFIFLGVIFAFIPNNVLGVVGGIMFGLWQSFFLNVIGTILGCAVVFWISRKLGRPVVEMLVRPEDLDRVEKKLSGKGNILFSIFMFIPFIPNDVVCYAAGFTKMRFRDYIIIVTLTRPWGILLSSYMGSSSLLWWHWVIIFAVMGLVLFFIIKYGNRIATALRKNKVWSPIADAFDEMGDLSIPLKINPKPKKAPAQIPDDQAVNETEKTTNEADQTIGDPPSDNK